MAEFEPASFCYKHHCCIYYPTAILFLHLSLNILSFKTIVTETFVIDHKENSPCLITNYCVIN